MDVNEVMAGCLGRCAAIADLAISVWFEVLGSGCAYRRGACLRHCDVFEMK